MMEIWNICVGYYLKWKIKYVGIRKRKNNNNGWRVHNHEWRIVWKRRKKESRTSSNCWYINHPMRNILTFPMRGFWWCMSIPGVLAIMHIKKIFPLFFSYVSSSSQNLSSDIGSVFWLVWTHILEFEDESRYVLEDTIFDLHTKFNWVWAVGTCP